MNNIEINTAQNKQLSQSLSDALDRNNLSQYLKKSWVFNKKTLVADFAYRKVHFSFDMTLLPEENFSVDLVRRDRSQTSFIITSSAQEKDTLISSAIPDEAVNTIVDKTTDLLNLIDIHYKTIEEKIILSTPDDTHLSIAGNKSNPKNLEIKKLVFLRYLWEKIMVEFFRLMPL